MRLPSLTKQVCDELNSRKNFGHSKKKSDRYDIVSIGTIKTYTKQCCNFTNYCRKMHRCKTLEDCRQYIPEYMEIRKELSPFTRKLDASALAKLYKASHEELGITDTGKRSRNARTRSRGEAVRDKHISDNGKYADYIKLCKCTGTRKGIIARIRGEHFLQDPNGNWFLHVPKEAHDKGGRARYIPILPEGYELAKRLSSLGDVKILPYIVDGGKLPDNADTHGYRHYYAKELYKMFARPVKDIPKTDRYIARKDLAGRVYDKKALKIVTEALGHSRINEPVQSYLE